MKKEEEKIVKHTIDIIFYGGTIGRVEYEIEEYVDDYIWEDFRKNWEANIFWYPCDWADCELKIRETTVDEIDMRKVIGAKYN